MVSAMASACERARGKEGARRVAAQRRTRSVGGGGACDWRAGSAQHTVFPRPRRLSTAWPH
eukprot:4230887-Alexandrium_andersonii.AAC.1